MMRSLARARVRAASFAGDRSRSGLGILGVLRQAAAALRTQRKYRRAIAGAARSESRTVPLAAARLRLDSLSRFSGAEGATLSGAMEGARACGCDAGRAGHRPMTPRDLVLATIRRSLGVTGAEAPRQLEVADAPDRSSGRRRAAARTTAASGAARALHAHGRGCRRLGRARHRWWGGSGSGRCVSAPPQPCRCACGMAMIRASRRCRGATRRRSR